MKKLALTLSILVACAVLLQAGPESFSGKEMKQVAPPPPACPSWAGFYIGGFGGYKFSNVDTGLDLNGLWDTQFPEGRDVVESHAPDNLNNSGAELGGLIGYNYQWHNWVFGVEAAGGYLWARDSEATGVFDNIPNDQTDAFNIGTSFKTHYLFTFGPRIGYAFCRWLPYVTGGLAVGDLEYDQGIVNVGGIGEGFIFHENGSASETNVGWFVGGGLEYALTNHWHLRGQYQYIDLGSVDFHTAGFGTPEIEPAGFTGHHEASLTEHNASFAIIYQF